jgi:predicted metal-dependent phosphoesterase TrpH
MKLDLHIHSEHSFDCDVPIEAIIRRAEQLGLGAVAITDHDTMSGCSLAEKVSGNVTVIPAEEITAEGGTHIIGLFLEEEIGSRNIFEIIDEIHNQRGLVLLPHPFRPGSGLMFNKERRGRYTGEETMKILSRVDLIEAASFGSRMDEIIDTDRFLALRPDLPQTSGSDAHHRDDIGKAYVELEKVKSNSLDDIREALIYSPRLIRYEVYSHPHPHRKTAIRTLHLKGKKKSLYFRAGALLPAAWRRSIDTIFRRTTRRLGTSTGGRFKMQTGQKNQMSKK